MGDGDPAGDCADKGADTTGVSADYYQFSHSARSGLGSGPFDYDVLMLFRETTFTFQTSEMDSTTMGLFRQAYGGSLVEYATGMDTTAQFQYRVGSSGYSDTITAAKLDSIDVIRIVAEARKPAPTGGVDDILYGWSVNIPLRNVRGNDGNDGND